MHEEEPSSYIRKKNSNNQPLKHRNILLLLNSFNFVKKSLEKVLFPSKKSLEIILYFGYTKIELIWR